MKKNLTVRDLEQAHEMLGHAVHAMRSTVNDEQTAVRDLTDIPDIGTDVMLAVVNVIAEGSFTKAAKKLGMSQPGLSRQVQRFEKAVGHQVIARRGTGAEITPQGISSLTWCISTLEGLIALVGNK